jgi:HAD superfamily hydrolase (TIGR01509 family)
MWITGGESSPGYLAFRCCVVTFVSCILSLVRRETLLYHGAIFDMDGLIFDTERLGVEASVKAGAEQGISLSREIILHTLGTSDRQTCLVYKTEFPAFDTERFKLSLKNIMFDEIAHTGMPVKRFARECVAAFRNAGIPVALASSNSSAVIAFYLKLAGMSEDFDVQVCGDKGLPSKPAPDIFLRAASLMDADPASCIVFEDSPNGLKAARAAGMRVYMVPDLIKYEDSLALYCDGVLKDLGEAITLLELHACR